MASSNFSPSADTLGKILLSAGDRIDVPDWQRSYSWQSDQTEMFWTDLKRFNAEHPNEAISGKEYFLGSIVFVNMGDRLLLLDGQQRLATTTILLAALREHRRPLDSAAAGRLQQRYIAELDDETESIKYVLNLNLYDREFFRQLIQSEGETKAKPKLRSHVNIQKAFGYFKSVIEEATAELDSAQALKWNRRIARVLLNNFSVVAITTTDEDTAASVFEALNDRGIGLSTPDLLRNFLLRSAKDAAGREAIADAWRDVYSELEQQSVEVFLRHYWISRYGDVKTRSLYREVKAELVDKKIDVKDFSQRLGAAASDYRALLDASHADDAVRRLLEGVNQLRATVLYPAMLAAMEIDLEKERLVLLADALTKLYVRHSVIGGLESTKLEEHVFGIGPQLRAGVPLTDILHALGVFAPPLESFVASFGVASISRVETAKYLLSQLEMSERGTEELVLAKGRRVQLEHIYPQQPLSGQRLEQHSGVINRVGNLTLLSGRLNGSIKNAPFKEKRVKAYAQSELEITKALLNHDDEHWGTDQIEARQRELALKAAGIWALPAELQSAFQLPPVVAGSGTTEVLIADAFPDDDEGALND